MSKRDLEGYKSLYADTLDAYDHGWWSIGIGPFGLGMGGGLE